MAIYEEIGATDKIGQGLRNKIQNILAGNKVTPANAVSEIKRLSEELSVFSEVISDVVAGFEELKIAYDGLEPGEAEVGMSIPFRVIESNLHGLQKEIHGFDKALKIFGELVEENPKSPQIKTIGSSDIQLSSILR